MNMKLLGVLFLTCVVTASQVVSQPLDYEGYAPTEDAFYDLTEQQAPEPEIISPPVVFMEKSQKLTLREGDDLDLSCETVTPPQTPIILNMETSNKDGELKTLTLFAGELGVYPSNFVANGLHYNLKNISRTETALYLCVIQHSTSGNTEIRYDVNVEYPPHIKPIKWTRQEVKKGDNVSFECKADGNPKPKVKWSRENGKLPSGAIEEKGKTVIFMDVDRHVEGTYVCSASNGIGKTAVAKKKLLVQYSPEIVTEKEIVRTGEGDKVELVCIVHSRPHAEVTWSREDNKTLAYSDNIKEMNEGHRRALIISHITEKDFGTYTCTASNDIGTTSTDINLTDLPMKPYFTSDPTSAHDDKYTLTWNIESYYNITEYRIKYKPVMENTTDDSLWKEDTFEIKAEDVEKSNITHRMKHVISGLKAATDYEAVASVKNELKWSDISYFKFSTKKESASHITGAGSFVSISILLLISSRIATMIS